jgi:hypothetical protein
MRLVVTPYGTCSAILQKKNTKQADGLINNRKIENFAAFGSLTNELTGSNILKTKTSGHRFFFLNFFLY